MFVEYRLQEVTRAKEKAFGIFTRTMAKFEKAIEKANKYIDANKAEMDKHELERMKREVANKQLNDHIAMMNKSVSQIRTIIGE